MIKIVKVDYKNSAWHGIIETPSNEFFVSTLDSTLTGYEIFKKEFLKYISEQLDEAILKQSSNIGHSSENKNKNRMTEIINMAIGKHYDLEVIRDNKHLNCSDLKNLSLDSYKNAELVHGLGTGKIHFLTQKGEYLFVPWDYILSMIPTKEKVAEDDEDWGQ